MVRDLLQAHCIGHGLIHPNHHGSLPAHDCVTAVGQLQDAASLAAEDRNMAAVIMLDPTAAFDLVDHRLLLAKMRSLHFSDSTVGGFESYLRGRWFSASVGSSTSELLPLGDKGLPKGSILGSLLFVISQVDLRFQRPPFTPTTTPA